MPKRRKRKDPIRELAEQIAGTLATRPRSTWPGLIAVALSGYRERVKDETLRELSRLERDSA